MMELDIFIPGETINLCIPTVEFANNSKWYSWFNDPAVTRYLEQGMFPNTHEEQVEFFRSCGQDRLILIISNKKEYIGTISLSHINLAKGMCDIAIVVDASIDRKMAPYISLEAIARMTEHAFSVMGINRIGAGQHVNLRGWQQRMELLGYKIEGMHANRFVKGHEIADTVTIACLNEDYQRIIGQRGCFWDSLGEMRARMKRLPKRSFSEAMAEYFNEERSSYYENIFSL